MNQKGVELLSSAGFKSGFLCLVCYRGFCDEFLVPFMHLGFPYATSESSKCVYKALV